MSKILLVSVLSPFPGFGHTCLLVTCLATDSEVAHVQLPGGDSVGILADGVVVVARGVDAVNGVLGVGVDARALEGRAVRLLLLGHDVLGSLQRLQVGVEEASLLADWLVASDHFQVLLEHFR